MTNPYSSLEARAFWSPAVAKRSLFDISELWQAPFPITRKTKIVTFGSCFAQHFSRALVARNFTWLDAEPAPKGLSAESARDFNYGIFSARTANIYTTSLLRQWTEWAVGETTPPEIFWTDEAGRVYDPFRPVIEPGGFATPEEMFASRMRCVEAFRTAIMDSGLFVFTLGLTESWWDADGGWEYPMCPGTAAGTFDTEKHVFRNQDYNFVRRNLMQAIRMIRAARKGGPRFLLTVSPVPLTATNSGNHVLVATMESKSILRAVAGDLSKTLSNVSYFPSYEIINAPPYRGSFFEPNMRSVNPNGVDHVMKIFFAGLSQMAQTERGHPSSPAPVGKETRQVETSDDLACEEELLAAFGQAK
ncbi:GSCFA domain-containing protein [Paracoccus alkanivorans]|uniref:GSCFA family protein n=1 Tax=Paracoccus alkanivorans TaxID=2116655 RepID=A0A3M0MFF1_9RHOB|nr:GSCFA domain-containing protein [Paracoccus alkanivorans]RMC36115.1 GSCFA family protein [Paracoccus alkanivorans]